MFGYIVDHRHVLWMR